MYLQVCKQPTWFRNSLAIGAFVAAGFFNPATSSAADFPPHPFYLQVTSHDTPAGIGDWYSAADGGNGANFCTINIPADWDPSHAVVIDVLSPDLNEDADPADTVLGLHDEGDDDANTSFTLYAPGAIFDIRNPDIMPDSGLFITGKLFTPNSVDHGDWHRFAVLPAPVAPGAYVLRVETYDGPDSDENQNSFKIRVGYDSDGPLLEDVPIPGTDPAPNDNPDSDPGTGDEIYISTPGMTLQHSASDNSEITLHRYVPPGLSTVRFHNFDYDSSTAELTYFSPSGVEYAAGPLSADSSWNGTGPFVNNRRSGDEIASTEAGIWTALIDINGNNQFNFESEPGHPMTFVSPPVPEIDLEKTNAAVPNPLVRGTQVTYTIDYANLSDPEEGGGKGYNFSLVDTLHAGATYNSGSASFVGPVGTVSEDSGVLTFTFPDPIEPGVDGSVTYTVTLGSTVTGAAFENDAVSSCTDSIGNLYQSFATVSLPLNQLPEAMDHSYGTLDGALENTPLEIPAAGVLTGATDPDSDPLTAHVSTQPSNGTVDIEEDGSFTYTPDPGFSGEDTFTYHVNDGYENSLPATVTITVPEDTRPEVTSVGYVDSATLTVTFNEPMGNGSTTPGNYVISDPGAGTLNPSPDSVVWTGGNTYQLIWNSGSLLPGELITITVDPIVEDAEEETMGFPRSMSLVVPGSFGPNCNCGS